MNDILDKLKTENKSNNHLLLKYSQLLDKELDRLYSKTDCVHNYGKHYLKSTQNGKQYYHCVQNSCHFFTNKSSIVVRHIRRHLNERPFICLINGCDQHFYQKCELRVHMLRHVDNKPFKCHQKDCLKSYTNRKALSLHLKKHSLLGYRFVCDISDNCRQLFPTNWLLNKHKKDKHFVVNQSMVKTMVKSVNKSVNKSVDKSMVESVDKSMVKSVDKSTKVATIKTKIEPKSELKTNPIKSSSKQSMVLNESIKSESIPLKDKLLSNKFLVKTSEDIGFEEVIRYIIDNCSKTQTNGLNGTHLDDNGISVSSVEELEPKSESNCLQDISCESVDKWHEIMDNSIAISTHNSNHRFVCKWCQMYSSDTIQSIVEHTSGHFMSHISTHLSESLQKKIQSECRNDFEDMSESVYDLNGICIEIQCKICQTFRTKHSEVMSFHLFLHSKQFI